MVVLGRFFSPYGVQGWLRVHAFGDDPLSWAKMPKWFLSPDAGAPDSSWKPYVPKAVRAHADGLIAKLAGVDDRTAAEVLDGFYFGATRDLLPPVKLDEYYWEDLIGLRVVNLQGQVLGCVKSLLETGAHDVLVVARGGDVATTDVAGRRGDSSDRLLPFVSDVVKSVDLSTRLVQVAWDVDW